MGKEGKNWLSSSWRSKLNPREAIGLPQLPKCVTSQKYTKYTEFLQGKMI
jgi:hypothetical protein